MTKNKPLNVLVVGAGMYVSGRGTAGYGTILPALYQAKRKGLVKSVTVCATKKSSVDALKAKNKELSNLFKDFIEIKALPEAESWNKNAYLEALGKGDYDCGIVAVPDHLHFEIGKSLIERGIHTLIVKPFTPDLNSAIELERLARSHNVYGAVEFHKRFDEANLKIREFIRKGRLGDVLYFLVEYSQKKSVPRQHFKEWVKKTNIFQYLGVHYVDVIYFCTGFLPVRVMATGQKTWLAKENIDTHDSIQAVVEWKDRSLERSFTSVILTNWIDPLTSSAMSDQKVKVIGTEGRIESDQKNRGLRIVTEASGIEDINPYFSEFFHHIDGESLDFRGYGCDSIMQFLLDCQSILTGNITREGLEGLRPTFESALVSTAVAEAVNFSLANKNRWVSLDSNMRIIH